MTIVKVPKEALNVPCDNACMQKVATGSRFARMRRGADGAKKRSQASGDTVLMFGRTVLGKLQRCEQCFLAVSAMIISFTPRVFSVVLKYNSNSGLKTKEPELMVKSTSPSLGRGCSTKWHWPGKNAHRRNTTSRFLFISVAGSA